ncbi:hypothetical protein FB45DRAFT_868630 [Roridomyces roridus]|uniref:Uncharacterized protein n=1 Tax=Roridomyces roridus TaxID=1738132 RepID=A0AAD7FJA9_9AGAR|nr:hypothetical protein FB45DRAFT_868630 [Roridomyces roridus]
MHWEYIHPVTPSFKGQRPQAGSKHRESTVRTIQAHWVYANAGWEFQRADLFPAVYGLAAERVEGRNAACELLPRSRHHDIAARPWQAAGGAMEGASNLWALSREVHLDGAATHQGPGSKATAQSRQYPSSQSGLRAC